MGNDLSKYICCVTCGACKKQELEEGNEGTSETKPILQVSGKTSMCADLQPSPPALEAFQQGSEVVQAVSQHQQPSAAAVEADVEPSCAADLLGMTEGWHSTGFLEAPADGDSKGEGEVLTQVDNQQEREQVSGTEEKSQHAPHASEAQPAAHTAQEEKLAADQEQSEEVEAGSELSPCAGPALQGRNLLNLMEFPSETAAAQDLEIKSSAGETLIGRNLLLSSVQVLEESEIYFSAEQVEETCWAELAEVSPQATERAEHTSLPETSALETLQLAQKAGETVDPSGVVADVTAEMYFTPTTFWECPYPAGESLEPANHLLDFFQQDSQSSVLTVQEMESLHDEEPAELSEVSQQSGHGVLGELEGEGSREHGAEAAASEAEPQRWKVQQTKELPDKPPTCAQVLVEEGTESPSEASRMSEELGSSTETD